MKIVMEFFVSFVITYVTLFCIVRDNIKIEVEIIVQKMMVWLDKRKNI